MGEQATSKPADFVSSLAFAQEYGIEAASMLDRPFIPAGNIVFGEMPKDAKAVFRKWKDPVNRTPTKTARPSRVIPLNEAITATRT